MVKQRFLTRFKPWLYAVIKVVGVIVGYQLIDQARRYFQYAPLNIVDLVLAATATLFAIGLLCAIWAGGEWCWFKLRRFRWSSRKFGRIPRDSRYNPAAGI